MMPILNINLNQVGLVGVTPNIVQIATNDTEAAVLVTGYLNNAVQSGTSFPMPCIAEVSTVASAGTPPAVGWFQVQHSGTNWSLVATTSPGDVLLPTVAQRIAVYTDTNGTLSMGGTAVNAGLIESGLVGGGITGEFLAYPTTASEGYLALLAVSNASGNFHTIISNAAAIGQSQTISIPDTGAATGNFILSGLTGAGIQHITRGSLEVDAGGLIAGIATGGTAGSLTLYPATAANGSLVLSPVANAGNHAATISNVTALAQASVYTLPDPANAVARILVGATATPFTTGHLLASSGTGGLVVDSGIATASVQLTSTIHAAQSPNIGGAGAGPVTVTQAGVATTSIIVASMVSSSNPVEIITVTAGTGNFAVTFSGNPGASAIINYIVFIAAQ